MDDTARCGVRLDGSERSVIREWLVRGDAVAECVDPTLDTRGEYEAFEAVVATLIDPFAATLGDGGVLCCRYGDSCGSLSMACWRLLTGPSPGRLS